MRNLLEATDGDGLATVYCFGSARSCSVEWFPREKAAPALIGAWAVKHRGAGHGFGLCAVTAADAWPGCSAWSTLVVNGYGLATLTLSFLRSFLIVFRLVQRLSFAPSRRRPDQAEYHEKAA